MVAAMAGFAVEDACIKLIAEVMPVGQILALLGAGGTLVFAALARRSGARLVSRDALARPVLLRNLGDVSAAVCFVTALALTPLSSASAILQAAPLAVTAGAALFLGERVGWRRWSAIAVGFAGVLMIVRPGLDGFLPASIFAVLSVAGLALRDVAYGTFAGRVVARIEAAGADVAAPLLAAGLARPYEGRGPRPDWCENSNG